MTKMRNSLRSADRFRVARHGADNPRQSSRPVLRLASLAALLMLGACGDPSANGTTDGSAAATPEAVSGGWGPLPSALEIGADGFATGAALGPMLGQIHGQVPTLDGPLARLINPGNTPLVGAPLTNTPLSLPPGPAASDEARFIAGSPAPEPPEARSFARTKAAMPTRAMLGARPTVDKVSFFESPQINPLALTPNGKLLLVTNTSAATLEIYDVAAGPAPILKGVVHVGLEPVSVRAQDNRFAWVVNRISDSVSVVDLDRLLVVRTVPTDDEPADVVFAGSPRRAWVSTSEGRNVMVFDPASPMTPLGRIAILGQQPRALAASPDGSKVYLGIFESGNGTTILTGKTNEVEVNLVGHKDGPYGGVNPPPNNGTAFKPPMRAGLPAAPTSLGLIVRRTADGKWFDDNSRDWTPLVTGGPERVGTKGLSRVKGWDLIDRDVAVIETATGGVSYLGGGLNIVMNLAVNPATGVLTTIGSDATNEVRFEPNLNGRFLRMKSASYLNGLSTGAADLNPHLTYAEPRIPAQQRPQSVSDTRGIVWNAAGTRAWVTAMGTNNVIQLNASGTRVEGAPITVGQGPTGIVLQEDRNRGYVLNRFDATISTLNLSQGTVTSTVPLAWDPTPQVVKDGRPILFNALRTSGTGHVACASCHLDGRTDRLAWDLSDPSAAPLRTTDAAGNAFTHHPMKGPMLTMTLVDSLQATLLHWRGDKPTLNHFAAAFTGLQGADAAPSAAEFTSFTNYLKAIRLSPNPYRNLDNTYADSVKVQTQGGTLRTGNANKGAELFEMNCRSCHPGNTGRGMTFHEDLPFGGAGVRLIAPRWQGFYRRQGFWLSSANLSTTGFGFQPDGSFDSTHNMTRGNDLIAFMYSFDGDFPYTPRGANNTNVSMSVPAAVGKQVTHDGTGPVSPTIGELIVLADRGQIAVVAHTCALGERRAARYIGNGQFEVDRGERFTTGALTGFATPESPVTFTGLRRGTEGLLGADHDGDGTSDGARGRSADRQCGNLVVNGSFESNAVAFGQIGSAENVSAWSVTGPVEVWRSPNGLSGIDGDSWVRLAASGTSSITQTIATPPSAALTLRFIYAAAEGSLASQNPFEVLWNGAVVATLRPDGLNGLQVKQHSVVVRSGATGSDTLTVRGNGVFLESFSLNRE